MNYLSVLFLAFFLCIGDVVFKLKSDIFPEEQLLDLQRVVTFEKINNQ